jgi:hypothetical protein
MEKAMAENSVSKHSLAIWKEGNYEGNEKDFCI